MTGGGDDRHCISFVRGAAACAALDSHKGHEGHEREKLAPLECGHDPERFEKRSGCWRSLCRGEVSEVDGRAVRIQLCDLPVVARLSADGAAAGEVLKARLVEADPERRTLKFEAAG
jgi:RNase II-type exonuclease C-terminal S1 domain